MVVKLILNRWRFGSSHATCAYEDGVQDNYDNGGGRKTSLKNRFAFFQTLSRRFFLAHFFPGVKYNAHIQVINRNLEKIGCCLFRFSIKQTIYKKRFTAWSWSCSERQRNVPKSVMHVQNCYFAHASLGAVYMGRRIPVVPFPKI